MAEKEKINPNRIKNRAKAFFPILIWTVIVIWCAIFLFMVAWGLMNTFKTGDGFLNNAWGFPSWSRESIPVVNGKPIPGGSKTIYHWDFGNYAKVLEAMKVDLGKGKYVYFPTLLFNTLYYCIVYALVAVLAPMLCSYIYAKYSKRVGWTKLVWVLVLISLYVPLSASLAASLKLAMQLGIYDNMFLFIVASFGPFGSEFLIYYAIWKGLSWEYAEAAFMDGASHWTVLTKVMFPMTITVFWVLFVTKVIALWTDYTTPMLFLPSYPTLAYATWKLNSDTTVAGASQPVRLGAFYLMAVPMFTLFMIFREKMMGSLTMGGLKG